LKIHFQINQFSNFQINLNVISSEARNLLNPQIAESISKMQLSDWYSIMLSIESRDFSLRSKWQAVWIWKFENLKIWKFIFKLTNFQIFKLI